MQIPDYKYPTTNTELDAQVQETRNLLLVALDRLLALSIDAIRISPGKPLNMALRLSRLAVSYALHALLQKSPIYSADGAQNRLRMMTWMESLALQVHGAIQEFESKHAAPKPAAPPALSPNSELIAQKILQRARAQGARMVKMNPPAVRVRPSFENGKCLN